MSAIVSRFVDSQRPEQPVFAANFSAPEGLQDPRTRRTIRYIKDGSFEQGSYAGRKLEDNSAWAGNADVVFVFDSRNDFDEPSSSHLNAPGAAGATKPATSTGKLLSREDEAFLFRKLHYHYTLAARFLQSASMCHGTVSQFREGQKHLALAAETRSYVAQCNLRLVVSIAKKYAAQTAVSPDELISHGNEGLLNALDQFDFRKGFRFSTYAYTAVQRAIFGGMRSETNRQNRMAKTSGSVDSLTKDAADCDKRETEARWAADTIASAQHLLDRRESTIIRARFGFGSGCSPQSFREIGDDIGLSKQRVASIYHAAIDKLRTALTAPSMTH